MTIMLVPTHAHRQCQLTLYCSPQVSYVPYLSQRRRVHRMTPLRLLFFFVNSAKANTGRFKASFVAKWYCLLPSSRPDHRKFCRQTEGQAIYEMVNALVKGSCTRSKLEQMLVEESSFGSDTLANNLPAFTRENHIVLLDMTFEPAKFSEVLSSWALGKKWSYKGVKGMLQINGITSRRRHSINFIDQPDDYSQRNAMEDSWARYRKEVDELGHYNDPLVLAVFRDVSRNTFYYHCPFLITSNALGMVQKRVKQMGPDGLDLSIKNHLS